MPYAPITPTPVMTHVKPRELCRRRYPGHPRGCPNYGKRETCPPKAKRWTPGFMWYNKFVAIWSFFPLGEHVEKMRKKHPDWTQRQLECCLYWQGTARKKLRAEIKKFMDSCVDPDVVDVYEVPEAHGVNVTATMRKLDVPMEWPPKINVCHVAIAVLPYNVWFD